MTRKQIKEELQKKLEVVHEKAQEYRRLKNLAKDFGSVPFIRRIEKALQTDFNLQRSRDGVGHDDIRRYGIKWRELEKARRKGDDSDIDDEAWKDLQGIKRFQAVIRGAQKRESNWLKQKEEDDNKPFKGTANRFRFKKKPQYYSAKKQEKAANLLKRDLLMLMQQKKYHNIKKAVRTLKDKFKTR